MVQAPSGLERVRGVGYKFTPSRATDGLDHSDEMEEEDADA